MGFGDPDRAVAYCQPVGMLQAQQRPEWAGAQNTTGLIPTLRRGIRQPSHEQDRPALVVLYYEYERMVCDKHRRRWLR